MLELIDNKNNLYKILNLSKNATKNEIKKKYKELILKYHPDKNKNVKTDKFIEIKNAYDILSDDNKKLIYDNELYINNISNSKNIDIINFVNEYINSLQLEILFKIINNKLLSEHFLNKFNFDLFSNNDNNNLIQNIIDIDITINFTLKEIWDCIKKPIKYKRITKSIFEEYIYPIDFIQIYEEEGEKIKINNKEYIGNINVKINIIELKYNNENYYIYNDELYLLLNSKRIVKNKFTVNYLDDCKYKFNLKKLLKINNELGLVYIKKNFGLLKYTNSNIEDINKNINNISHGNLFFIVLI